MSQKANDVRHLGEELQQQISPMTAEHRISRATVAGTAASLEIAEELGVSAGTVQNCLSEAISKLGAANRVEAARIARAKGWL